MSKNAVDSVDIEQPTRLPRHLEDTRKQESSHWYARFPLGLVSYYDYIPTISIKKAVEGYTLLFQTNSEKCCDRSSSSCSMFWRSSSVYEALSASLGLKTLPYLMSSWSQGWVSKGALQKLPGITMLVVGLSTGWLVNIPLVLSYQWDYQWDYLLMS